MSSSENDVTTGCAVWFGRFGGASGRLNTFNVGLLRGFWAVDFYRVNFEVNNLKPFACLAFPQTTYLKTLRKQPIFGDELVTSFCRSTSPTRIFCKDGFGTWRGHATNGVTASQGIVRPGPISDSRVGGGAREALASVRRPNCTYGLPVCSFHEDSATPGCKRRN